MSTSCRVAVIQLTSTGDKGRNQRKCLELLEKAKSYGAEAAFLPEGFDFIGESSEQTLALAESICQPDGTVAYFQSLASKLGIVLSLGGFHEIVSSKDSKEEVGKLSNTHIVINANGDISATYRKAHLFDVEVPERNLKLQESKYVNAGNEIPRVIDLLNGFKLGLAICYDLRFPEMSLLLRRRGANILTFPSAFTVATGSAGHWSALLKARAIETQSYVIAAAQTGSHNKKRSSFGHACIIDPWGTVIAECPEGEGVVVAELNLDRVHDVRRNMPIESHRRQDLYSLSSLGDIQVADEKLDKIKFNFGQHINSGRCIIFESRLSYALVNKKPVRPGHVLVIPKRSSAERLGDLTVDELQDLMTSVQQAQKLVESYFKATSSTITIQDGPEAGQTVKHVHVHILPRHLGDFAHNDDIYQELENHDKGDNIQWRSEDEMAAESRLLRAHFLETF